MKIYSHADVPNILGGLTLPQYLARERNELSTIPCTLPTDTGSKTQMASYLGELYLASESSSALIAITGWSAWPSQTNFDLFDRYRESFGERRRLIESPIHHFLAHDKAAFASVLGMCLYFLWDAEVIDFSTGSGLTIGHHGSLDVHVRDEDVSNRVISALVDFGCDLVPAPLSA